MEIGFGAPDLDRVGECRGDRWNRKTRRNGARHTDGGESTSGRSAGHGGGVWLSPPYAVAAVRRGFREGLIGFSGTQVVMQRR